MDQFIHLLDPHPNWTHHPNVPSQVPFHKGIHHRLYQTMSCGYIFILDVHESFLNYQLLLGEQHQVNQIDGHGLLAITQQAQLQS